MVQPKLECVTCRGALRIDGDTLVCLGCGTRFPIIGDVPCILPGAPTAQHRAQTEYFDAEFAALSRYEPERWRESFIRRIFRALDIAANAPYLDVGVGGSGATVIEAARSGVSAVGCDLSIEGVVQARRFAEAEGVGGASFVACAAESLPFRDTAFGCASSVAVLEHIDDDGLAARELARVIRPGGLVWITVPHTYRHIPAPLRPVYRRHDRILGHKRHYDEAELVALMARSGFAHVGTEYSGHPVKVAQFVLDRIVPRARGLRSRIWWNLEEIDRRQGQRARQALQLSAIFRRV